MSFKILCVLFLSIIGELYSEEIEMLRIYNGERATIDEFPHTVYINKNGAHHCGGSVISEDIILTAAHCFTNTDIDELTISAGTNDCREVIDEYKLENFIIHEKFNEDILKNDIAVIKLKRPMKFRSSLQPIKLVRPGEDVPKGKVVRTAGCGTIDERGVSRDAKKLLSATLRALSVEECLDLEPQFNAESLICLRDDKEHQSVCHGDSGSGFVVDGKLAGVVSYGPKVCGESPLSGATMVSMFIKWIDDTIKTMDGKPATVFGAKPLDTPKDKHPCHDSEEDKDNKNKIKEHQKEILKTKLNLDSGEDSTSSGSSDTDSRSNSDESDFRHRVTREERERIGDMLNSMHETIERMKERVNEIRRQSKLGNIYALAM